jgi:hypothetical protein
MSGIVNRQLLLLSLTCETQNLLPKRYYIFGTPILEPYSQHYKKYKTLISTTIHFECETEILLLSNSDLVWNKCRYVNQQMCITLH